MSDSTLESALHQFLDPAYPGIEIRTEPFAQDPTRLAIHFVHPLFAVLYPEQRYHYLVHLIPEQFYAAHLADTVWFELAPGEQPEALRYSDPQLIQQIAPDVMRVLEVSGFIKALDLAFCPRLPLVRGARCHGDFRVSQALLPKHGIRPEEHFDVFHVLMSRGGYCDCEILFNAVEESRLKARYWKARAAGKPPYDPHAGSGA